MDNALSAVSFSDPLFLTELNKRKRLLTKDHLIEIIRTHWTDAETGELTLCV